MNRLHSIAATLAFALSFATAGQAATLGLSVAAAPLISGSAEVSNDDYGFILSGSDGSSTAPAAASGLDVSIFGDIAGSAPYSAALFVTEGSESFLAGDLLAVGFVTDNFGADTLELLYGNLTGSAAGAFGAEVLLELTGEFGEDPLSGFASFFAPVSASYEIASVVTTTPIPVPAGFPLLAGALALGAAAHGSKRRTARR